MLTVMSTNPNGAPDNGGTQFLLGLSFSDSENSVITGGDVTIAGAMHDTVSPAGQAITGFADVVFESQKNFATAVDPGPDAYNAANDSYWASPWANGGGSLFPPMGAQILVVGDFSTTTQGPTTIPFAFVNVPDGGEVLIMGEIARNPTSTEGLTDEQLSALIAALSVGGNLNHTLSSTGTLTNVNPIPEPSSFALLGLLGIGAVIRFRMKKRSAK